MANVEHVALLIKQGVAAWNAWRDENPNIRPDLHEADLAQADLRQADLRRASLSRASLREADLREANLNLADLSGADLSAADLREADLQGVILSEANLSGANLSEANLSKADLQGVNLSEADLSEMFSREYLLSGGDFRGMGGADLSGAHLRGANLSGANLSGAHLNRANLIEAKLHGANLCQATLIEAYVIRADLSGAHLRGANLSGANLMRADLSVANLSGASLMGANLSAADLSGANLSAADLSIAMLVNTNLTGADLTGCRIFGVSAWRVKLDRTRQQDLVITPEDEPTVTVDNIEVAQFIYLLLHNEKIRDVIDTIGKKGVLLLGRFTEGRMMVLERLRDKLRELGFVPMVFNFDKPETKDFTETVRLLCNLSHFVIVDITNPRSAPLELQATVPDYMVPFAPILQHGEEPFSMFVDLQNKYDWVLQPVVGYPSVDRLIEGLEDKVVRPAEAKFNQLLARRTKQLRVENI